MPGEGFARLIEHGDGLPAGLFREIALVRDPGAAGIFQTKGFGFGCDAFDIITKFFVRKMGAEGYEASFVQLCLELFGRQAVGAGEFHVLYTPPFDLVEGAGHVLLELIAEAVELETDGTLEPCPSTGSGTGGASNEESQVCRTE